MSAQMTEIARATSPSNRRPARTRTVSTRVAEAEAHLFTELVGIQLLLMNTLGPILRGERMAGEEVDVVFRQVQSRKAGKAQEILDKRLSRELEARHAIAKRTRRDIENVLEFLIGA